MIVVCYSRGIKETDEINRYRNKGYSIIEQGNRRGVSVTLKSSIVEVEGFPLVAGEGTNANLLVDKKILPRK